jgi:hypothetical protein
MREIERTVSPQEGLGHQKVRAGSEGDDTQTNDRSASWSLSKVVMQNIRIQKQKHTRRSNLQEIKLANAWSAGDGILKEGWIKGCTPRSRGSSYSWCVTIRACR